MPVHADEDFAARPRNGGVQRRRRDSAGIVNEMNARRTGSHRFDNFPRAVGGHSVNHHDFHTIRRVILRQHGAQAAGDVMSLISDWQNDAHQRRGANGHRCTLACLHSIHPSTIYATDGLMIFENKLQPFFFSGYGRT
jgi:hypothetical protein